MFSALRRLLVLGILGGAGYGYYQHRANPESPIRSPWDRGARVSVDAPGVVPGASGIVPVADLGQVFRLDVRPEWVMSTWSRVSTGLGDMKLQGYRVPLVTGTNAQDLAGSLTYYFDSGQRLRRINFVGTTADYRLLAQLVQERFGYKRVGGGNARNIIYARKQTSSLIPFASSGPAAKGRLRISPAPVVTVNDPSARYEVDLVIEAT